MITLIDRTLTGTTPLGQSGPGSNGNEGVLNILQSSRTGASYPGHLLGRGPVNYSTVIQLVYSAAPPDSADIDKLTRNRDR